MFKQVFMILLLGHILGDFYAQTETMAKKKENTARWVWLHGLSYGVTILVVLLPIISWQIFIAGITAAVLHLLIDVMKYYYVIRVKKKSKLSQLRERNIFFADQCLHILCLIIISYYFIISKGSIGMLDGVPTFFAITGLSAMGCLRWVTALLIIHKPANIVISKLLIVYKPKEEKKDRKIKDDLNAGRFIGTVERIIILIFISISQFSAIGLVLTAKSIARYDRISKEKDFAEYYLLGTLVSTLIVIVAVCVIF